ncbi:MAG: hypothetical protein WDO68_18835 [Gammaproteobacteria bacterium]
MTTRTRRSIRWAAMLALAAVATAQFPAANAAGQPCDEACLNQLVDTYLTALVAHDASRIPATKEVRYTENTIALPMTEGLWATASALKKYRHVIPDVEGGAVGFYATIEENGKGALLGGRMKVVDRKVSELEVLVARSADMGAMLKTDATEVRPAFLTLVPAGKRASRESLANAAKLYFDGLEQDTGEIVPFADDCKRFENGTQTAGDGARGHAITLADGKIWNMPTGCRASFNTRMFSYITRIDHRRYPVVDRSRGVAMGFVTFQHGGNVPEVDVPGVGKVPALPTTDRPFAVAIAESFEVKDGKIHEIEAVMITVPYGAGLGWEK